MAKKMVKINCKGSANRKLAGLKILQGELKELSEENSAKLRKRIEKYGFDAPFFVYNSYILDGTQRYKVLKDMVSDGWQLAKGEVPVVEIKATSITDAKERILGYVSQFGKLTTEGLSEFVVDIKDLDYELLDLPDFDIDNFLEEAYPEETGLTGEDSVPENVEPVCKLGELWQLGEHRLLCGDSTKKEDVERLMAGEKADMVFTDPPYGVDYEGKTKDKLTIKNDKMSEDQLGAMVKNAFDCVDMVLRPGGYCLATVPPGPLHLIFAGDWIEREWLRQIMVWNKDCMVMGHSEYHYKHEPILFGWKPGDRLKSKDRTKTTVWDFDRPKRSKEHPTMKPVAMWEYGVQNHTKKEDLIYEPFCGRGTTIIACEKTNRKCYGMELDPKYCDVIISRWEEYTGKKAKVDNAKESTNQ